MVVLREPGYDHQAEGARHVWPHAPVSVDGPKEDRCGVQRGGLAVLWLLSGRWGDGGGPSLTSRQGAAAVLKEDRRGYDAVRPPLPQQLIRAARASLMALKRFHGRVIELPKLDALGGQCPRPWDPLLPINANSCSFSKNRAENYQWFSAAKEGSGLRTRRNSLAYVTYAQRTAS